MAITKEQLQDLGFKPAKRATSLGTRKYDSLVYNLNKTDYLYLGYNIYTKKIDFKRLWKTFVNPETGEKITYPVDRLGELTYTNVKEYLEQEVDRAKRIEEYYDKQS